MIELKPCPFCGSRNVGFETCYVEGSHWVECEDCHAMSTPNYSREEATRDWNNRPHENKIRKESFLSGFNASGEGFNGEHGAEKEEVDKYLNEWIKEYEK